MEIQTSDIVQFIDEYGNEKPGTVVGFYRPESGPEILTIHYTDASGKTREVGSIKHHTQREEGADGKKCNCWIKVIGDTKHGIKETPTAPKSTGKNEALKKAFEVIQQMPDADKKIKSGLKAKMQTLTTEEILRWTEEIDADNQRQNNARTTLTDNATTLIPSIQDE